MEDVILGIDPGTVVMGYGLVKQIGKTLSFVEMDVLNLSKIVRQEDKLHRIFDRTIALIEQHHPSCLAIEAPFYGKNVQSMLKLGRAQGVAIAAALSKDIAIYEYAPRKIKMAITGKGSAGKEQVAKMLFHLLKLDVEMPKYLDATDGLAAAVCHALQNHSEIGNQVGLQRTPSSKTTVHSKKYSNWSTFVSLNQSRIQQ